MRVEVGEKNETFVTKALIPFLLLTTSDLRSYLTMSSKNAIAGPSSTTEAASTQVDAELEKLLSREASAFQREVEVERILKAFKLK